MAKIQIKSEKLTPLGGIFSGNGAFFPNTDFSDLSDYYYQKNQMNLYSFTFVFLNTDFSDLTDYQMNLYSFQLIFSNKDFSDLSDYQMNLYSFQLVFPNTDFSDLTDYQMNLYSFQLVFSNKDFSDLSDYQMNQMNLYSFPQLDSTLSSVIYSTLGLRCSSFHFMACFLAMAELK